MNKKLLCLSVLPISVLLITCDNSNTIDEDIYSTNEYTTEVANLMVNYETTLEPLNDFTLKGYEDSGIKKRLNLQLNQKQKLVLKLLIIKKIK